MSEPHLINSEIWAVCWAGYHASMTSTASGSELTTIQAAKGRCRACLYATDCLEDAFWKIMENFSNLGKKGKKSRSRESSVILWDGCVWKCKLFIEIFMFTCAHFLGLVLICQFITSNKNWLNQQKWDRLKNLHLLSQSTYSLEHR